MDYQALYGWRISLPIALSLGPSSDFPGIEFRESTFHLGVLGRHKVFIHLLEPTNFPMSVHRVTPEVPGLYKVQIHSTLVEVLVCTNEDEVRGEASGATEYGVMPKSIPAWSENDTLFRGSFQFPRSIEYHLIPARSGQQRKFYQVHSEAV